MYSGFIYVLHSVPTPVEVGLYKSTAIHIYLFHTQPEPVLQSFLSETNTIKDQKRGGVALIGAQGQRVQFLVRENAQMPAHGVVANLHQLVRVWRVKR